VQQFQRPHVIQRPSIHCIVDTAAEFCTGNYHFFSAIAKRYPHCVAKIFLPKDYSPIILSGIVQDDLRAVTTDLAVAFQFHLPYPTKEGCQTSFIATTGPQVSVYTVLGLPLITAAGMIIDTIDNVVEAKHLDCPLFKIDFRHTTKTIPAIEEDATTHYIEFKDVQNVLAKTKAYIIGVCKCYQMVKPPKICISKLHRQVGAVSIPKVYLQFNPLLPAGSLLLRQMILEIITTKFLGMPDTCEFLIRPDQALLGNQ
jgi:hypothetical protein